ncbi:hypothetical protein [Paraflavitalea speifideaquila]|uniref:hypothetical protein n=1 Tax=Paraflavitalea speifideaquila TaxID=3076558 RepID=UPI0028EF2650|nr:hypothetical protein [Paraflavitalea speifideiaquila]
MPKQSTPSYYLKPGGPGPKPIQVTRINYLDPNATAINNTIQNYIKTNFPGSVWQYYSLVNVIWSQSSPNNQTSLYRPLYTDYLSLPSTTVANTTLETYAQRTTCFTCHKNATIAGSATYASDFSFSLGAATSPALLKEKNARLKMLLKR